MVGLSSTVVERAVAVAIAALRPYALAPLRERSFGEPFEPNWLDPTPPPLWVDLIWVPFVRWLHDAANPNEAVRLVEGILDGERPFAAREAKFVERVAAS